MVGLMMSCAPVMRGGPGISVTEDHLQVAIERRKHEARGDEGPKAEHRQHEWSGPVAGATIT
jgi:hypothetical protein